jgi:hypothetical protein
MESQSCKKVISAKPSKATGSTNKSRRPTSPGKAGQSRFAANAAKSAAKLTKPSARHQVTAWRASGKPGVRRFSLILGICPEQLFFSGFSWS